MRSLSRFVLLASILALVVQPVAGRAEDRTAPSGEIAFVGTTSRAVDVYTANVDGTDLTPLTHDRSYDFRPS